MSFVLTRGPGPFRVTFTISDKAVSVYDGTGNYETNLVVGAMIKAGKTAIKNLKVGRDK